MMRLRGWRSFIAVVFLFALGVVVATLCANRGTFPTTVARQAVALLESRWPVKVEIGQAHFNGPSRLVLEQVILTSRDKGPIAQPVTIDQVHLNFDLSAMVGGRPLVGLRQISLVSPRITLDLKDFLGLEIPETGTSPGTSSGEAENAPSDHKESRESAPDWPQVAISVRRGQIVWVGVDAPEPVQFDLTLHSSPHAFMVKRFVVSRGAGRLAVDGDLNTQGKVTARLRLSDWLAADLCRYLPGLTVEGRGSVSADLTARGPWYSPTVSGQASLQGARLFSSKWPFEEPLPLVEARARFSVTGGSWDFDALELLSASGRLMGQGQLRQGRFDMEISAEKLSVPADIPFLGTWGVTGTATFGGTLVGDVVDPVLSGRATLRDGTLWNEPVSEAQGRIWLSRDRFSFDGVQVTSSGACYGMRGAISGLSDTGTANLSLDMKANAGRIEQLLAVLGVDIDAKGRLDGTLSFEGPLDALITSGDVLARDATFFGESIPMAQGAFRWGDGELRLHDVRAYSGEGSLVVDGSAALDGAFLRLKVDMNDWPMEEIRYAHLGSGLLSWSGEVSGSSARPYLAGKLIARDVRLGEGSLQRLEGIVSYDGHDLESSGLVATTVDGGSWWASGKIADLGGAQQLAINLRIADQSLSSLLAMGGHRIPAALVDGTVRGTVQIEGSAGNPRALLHLRLAERVSTQDAFELDLRIAERRVKILRVSGA